MNIILDLGNKITNFNQTQQQFDEIQQIIENNQRLLNDPKCAGTLPETWKIFRVTWHYRNQNNGKFQTMEKHFMQNAPNDSTAATLDKVWAMYFATKADKYAKCIFDASQKSPHPQVRMAAEWSYNSIINNVNMAV